MGSNNSKRKGESEAQHLHLDANLALMAVKRADADSLSGSAYKKNTTDSNVHASNSVSQLDYFIKRTKPGELEVDEAGLNAWFQNTEEQWLLQDKPDDMNLSKDKQAKVSVKLDRFVSSLEKKDPQQRIVVVSKLMQHGEHLSRGLKARHRLRMKFQERLVNGKLSTEPLKEPFKFPLQILPVVSETSGRTSTVSKVTVKPESKSSVRAARLGRSRAPRQINASHLSAPNEHVVNIVAGGDPGDDDDDDSSSGEDESDSDGEPSPGPGDELPSDDDDDDEENPNGEGGGGGGGHNPVPPPVGDMNAPQDDAVGTSTTLMVIPFAVAQRAAGESSMTVGNAVVRAASAGASSMLFHSEAIPRHGLPNAGSLAAGAAYSGLAGIGIGFIVRMFTYRFPWIEKVLRNKWIMVPLSACCVAAMVAVPFLSGATLFAACIMAAINFVAGLFGSTIGQWLANKLINSTWFKNTRNTWGLRHLHPPEMPPQDENAHPAPLPLPEAVHPEPLHIVPQPAPLHQHGEPGFMHVGLCSICQADKPITDGFIHMQPAQQYLRRFGEVVIDNPVHHVHMTCHDCAQGWVARQERLEAARLAQAEFEENPSSPRLQAHAVNLQLRCVGCHSDTYRFSLMSPEEEEQRVCNQCLHTGQCEHRVGGAPCGQTNTVFAYTGDPDAEDGVQLTAACCRTMEHSQMGIRLAVLVGQVH